MSSTRTTTSEDFNLVFNVESSPGVGASTTRSSRSTTRSTRTTTRSTLSSMLRVPQVQERPRKFFPSSVTSVFEPTFEQMHWISEQAGYNQQNIPIRFVVSSLGHKMLRRLPQQMAVSLASRDPAKSSIKRGVSSLLCLLYLYVDNQFSLVTNLRYKPPARQVLLEESRR